ncbi:DnaJ domain containing protein [Aphelenchoides avenae]|nr:DnaJ domain containing protein [Aphelenchus avenae]
MGIWDEFYDKAKSLFNEQGQPKRRCYYEILGVEKDATDDELKKAYRAQALQWHPDKNPDRVEECNAYFVLLQQAYDVLSDPQERAFYDKHRENIIHGGGTEETKDEGINLYPYFQTCYKGLGDDKEGFYTVYRELFDKLAAEEYPYIEEDEDKDFPSFGKSDSDYDRLVGPFYNFWSDFSTRRSFAWLDKWNLRDAPNRPTARAMEKENKKYREGGRRARNEEIRNLVMYVRKRDKRVKQYREQLDDRRKAELQRVEEERRQKIKEDLERLNDHVIDEEEHKKHLQDLEEIENALDAQFGTVGPSGATSDEDEEAAEDYYCIVCEKGFKNEKSYANHQKSKKHKQAVEDLRRVMKEEDAKLLLGSDKEEQDKHEDACPPKGGGKSNKKRRKARKQANNSSSGESDEEQRDNVPEDKPTNDTTDLSDAMDRARIGDAVEKADPSTSARVKTSKGKPKQKNGSSAQPSKVSEDAQSGPKGPVASECKKCGLEFESRSKLFQHLQDTGHAILKTVPAPTLAASSKKTGKQAGKARK